MVTRRKDMNLILICTYIASSFELLLSCQLVEFILYKSLIKSGDTSLSCNVLLYVTSLFCHIIATLLLHCSLGCVYYVLYHAHHARDITSAMQCIIGERERS